MLIAALAEWNVPIAYADIAHLFGTVDAGDEWDRLLHKWCGRTAAELEAIVRPRITPLKEQQPLLPGVSDLLDLASARGWKLGLGTGNTGDVGAATRPTRDSTTASTSS